MGSSPLCGLAIRRCIAHSFADGQQPNLLDKPIAEKCNINSRPPIAIGVASKFATILPLNLAIDRPSVKVWPCALIAPWYFEVPVTGIQINIATIAAAKARAVPGAKQYDVLDSRVEGLRLRVGARGVRWQLRFRFQGASPRLDLGDVDEWKVKEVLDIATDAKRLVRSGTLRDDAWMHSASRTESGRDPLPRSSKVCGTGRKRRPPLS